MAIRSLAAIALLGAIGTWGGERCYAIDRNAGRDSAEPASESTPSAPPRRLRKMRWQAGDIFGVPLADGNYALGQALGTMGEFVNVVNVALFDLRFKGPNNAPHPDPQKLIAVVSTTRDLLDKGHWIVVGHAGVVVDRSKWPNEHLANEGYTGAETNGSQIIGDFLAAYFGLLPWNEYKDPDYFDRLLISPSKKPPTSSLKFK